jgi:cation transport ATPase
MLEMLRLKEQSFETNRQGQKPPILPVLLAVLAHLPVVSGMNVGTGVHAQSNPFLGAALVFVGWCLWLYAFHLCVRGDRRKQKLTVMVIVAVPIVLAIFGAIVELIYDQFNVFYLYLLIELLLLIGAARIIAKQGPNPRREEESLP